MKANSPVATMLDAESGRTILRKTWMGLAPSTRADSSISGGILRKNMVKIRTVNGKVRLAKEAFRHAVRKTVQGGEHAYAVFLKLPALGLRHCPPHVVERSGDADRYDLHTRALEDIRCF